MIGKYFQFCELFFHFLDGVVWSIKGFVKYSLSYFFLLLVLLVSYLRTHPLVSLNFENDSPGHRAGNRWQAGTQSTEQRQNESGPEGSLWPQCRTSTSDWGLGSKACKTAQTRTQVFTCCPHFLAFLFMQILHAPVGKLKCLENRLRCGWPWVAGRSPSHTNSV